MKIDWSDPIIYFCLAAIFLCLFGLAWLIGKLKNDKVRDSDVLSDENAPLTDADLGLSSADSSLSDTDLLGEAPKPLPPLVASPPENRSSVGVSPVPPPAGGNKEVAERLETMTQRLADMQQKLNEQLQINSGVSGSPSSVGQGFSPETVDKLLKIIGNVIQQVDVLQKAMTVSKEATGSADGIAPNPATGAGGTGAAKPAPSSGYPVAAPPPSGPQTSPPFPPIGGALKG